MLRKPPGYRSSVSPTYLVFIPVALPPTSGLPCVGPTCPHILATDTRYTAAMTALAALVTVSAPIAYSTGVPRASGIIAHRTRRIVVVYHHALLWRVGTVLSLSDMARVATCVMRIGTLLT
jgi:hypothetical protein